MKTKNSKTFRTYFVPVSEMAMTLVEEWIRFRRAERGAVDDAPLFPSTQTGIGNDGRFQAVGLSEEHWRTTSAVRDVFRAAFKGAGLPYFHPHTLRKTLVAFAEKTCLTPEQFKAFSQNIGHESPMTTFSSYGAVHVSRQGEIIRELRRQHTPPPNVADEIVEKLARRLAADGITQSPMSSRARRRQRTLISAPYDVDEHPHRFAAWASSRAAQRGFTTVADLVLALEATDIRADGVFRRRVARPLTVRPFDEPTCRFH